MPCAAPAGQCPPSYVTVTFGPLTQNVSKDLTTVHPEVWSLICDLDDSTKYL
ncbi:hypothetical protein DPMN_006789 [Dreissena polymorpha]|uniref:Uncharacterized protein n=1 Tax=Dreissena polymorpha TaxID=45954 RepID=A0A9D4MW16_DREPO|nr:hypothetical protein DPMN_006789 [Dreissena polymorpha]